MTTPRISVVTVCRNAEGPLRQAADSVLKALGATDEWVVQDGASGDGSADFIRSLGDSRIRLESAPDQGIYDAMNRAVQRISGDYVLFLGTDDRLAVPLDEVRPHLTKKATLYYGDVRRVQSGDRYAGPFDGSKLARTNLCQQSVFYPASVFRKERFDTRYRHQADWVLNMACHADPEIGFEYIPMIIAEYGQSGVSSTGIDTAFQRDYRRLLRRYFPLRQRWRPALMSWLSDVYRALPGVPAPQQKPARAK